MAALSLCSHSLALNLLDNSSSLDNGGSIDFSGIGMGQNPNISDQPQTLPPDNTNPGSSLDNGGEITDIATNETGIVVIESNQPAIVNNTSTARSGRNNILLQNIYIPDLSLTNKQTGKIATYNISIINDSTSLESFTLSQEQDLSHGVYLYSSFEEAKIARLHDLFILEEKHNNITRALIWQKHAFSISLGSLESSLNLPLNTINFSSYNTKLGYLYRKFLNIGHSNFTITSGVNYYFDHIYITDIAHNNSSLSLANAFIKLAGNYPINFDNKLVTLFFDVDLEQDYYLKNRSFYYSGNKFTHARDNNTHQLNFGYKISLKQHIETSTSLGGNLANLNSLHMLLKVKF